MFHCRRAHSDNGLKNESAPDSSSHGTPVKQHPPRHCSTQLRLCLKLRKWLMRAKCSPLVLDATLQNRYITVQYHDAIGFAHAPHVEVGVFCIPLGNLA